MITAASSCSPSRWLAYLRSSWPMPASPWPKKKSPTMAPMTDRPAEMRSPAKIAGRAAGNISLRSRVQPAGVVQREQVVHRRGRRTAARTACSAMIGNSEMITQTITRDAGPVPNQNEISGTSARIGIACSITMYGNDGPLERTSVWLISMARPMPRTMAMARPMSGHLHARPQRRRGSRRSCPSRGSPISTTSCGGRSRNRRRASSTT